MRQLLYQQATGEPALRKSELGKTLSSFLSLTAVPRVPAADKPDSKQRLSQYQPGVNTFAAMCRSVPLPEG